MQLDRKLHRTMEYLEKYRLVSDEVIVSYSGGKDSKVILDLCSKVFRKVHVFFQYFIDGLEVIEKEIRADEARYGVMVHRYPGFGLYDAIENSTYCDVYYKMDDLSRFTYDDAVDDMKRITGCRWVAHGGKYADYAARRKLILDSELSNQGMIYPIKEWAKRDVVNYLSMQGIKLPDTAYATSGSVDLETNNILWMYDKYPEDFLKVEKYFPYIRAVVYRREFYGIGNVYGPNAKQGIGRTATQRGYGEHRDFAKEAREREKAEGGRSLDEVPDRAVRDREDRPEGDQERSVQPSKNNRRGKKKPQADN